MFLTVSVSSFYNHCTDFAFQTVVLILVLFMSLYIQSLEKKRIEFVTLKAQHSNWGFK